MKPTILILHGDRGPDSRVVELLTDQGFDTTVEHTRDLPLCELPTRRLGVIILTWDDPMTNGDGLISLLRRVTDIPMIAVGPAVENVVVTAILQGADTYVKEPYSAEEILVRVRNLLERSASIGARKKSSNESGYDDEEISAFRSSLTDTEARLFDCLIERRDSLVGHDQLMAQVWGGSVKKERLRFYVYSLRQKLNGRGKWKLHTQQGVGYRIIPSTPVSTGGV